LWMFVKAIVRGHLILRDLTADFYPIPLLL
jgi:hypothetical protein